MGKRGFLCLVLSAVLLYVFCSNAEGGEVIVAKWRSSSKTCNGFKGALITVRYNGEGSRLISNGCFAATFQDGSTCDGSGGDFDDIRVSGRTSDVSRRVCFCENPYGIRAVEYRCQDSF